MCWSINTHIFDFFFTKPLAVKESPIHWNTKASRQQENKRLYVYLTSCVFKANLLFIYDTEVLGQRIVFSGS